MRPSILLVLAAITFPSTATSQQWEAWWRNQAESVLEVERSHPQISPALSSRDEIVAVLVGALDDPFHGTRQTAVRALGRLGAPLPTLTPLLSDEVAYVRQAACLALGFHETKDGLPYLIAIMKDSKRGRELTGRHEGVSPTTGAVAALALGLRGSVAQDPARVDLSRELSMILEGEFEDEVRIAAALALGAMKSATASECLMTCAAREGEIPAARAAAAWALGRLGDASHDELLIDLLRSAPATVARSAALALTDRPRSATRNALLDAAVERRDDSVANFALLGLGNSDSLTARETLFEAWKAGEPEAAAFAVTALTTHFRRNVQNAASFRSTLRERAKTEKNPTRLAAMMIAAGRIGCPGMVDTIRHWLTEHWSVTVRAHAATTLALFGDRHSSAELHELVFDRGDALLRQRCAQALAHVGGAAEKSFLVDELVKPRHPWKLRVGIAYGLSLEPDETAIGRLSETVTASDRTDPYARMASAWLLGRFLIDTDRRRAERVYHSCDPGLECPALSSLLYWLP